MILQNVKGLHSTRQRRLRHHAALLPACIRSGLVLSVLLTSSCSKKPPVNIDPSGPLPNLAPEPEPSPAQEPAPTPTPQPAAEPNPSPQPSPDPEAPGENIAPTLTQPLIRDLPPARSGRSYSVERTILNDTLTFRNGRPTIALDAQGNVYAGYTSNFLSPKGFVATNVTGTFEQNSLDGDITRVTVLAKAASIQLVLGVVLGVVQGGKSIRFGPLEGPFVDVATGTSLEGGARLDAFGRLHLVYRPTAAPDSDYYGAIGNGFSVRTRYRNPLAGGTAPFDPAVLQLLLDTSGNTFAILEGNGLIWAPMQQSTWEFLPYEGNALSYSSRAVAFGPGGRPLILSRQDRHRTRIFRRENDGTWSRFAFAADEILSNTCDSGAETCEVEQEQYGTQVALSSTSGHAFGVLVDSHFLDNRQILSDPATCQDPFSPQCDYLSSIQSLTSYRMFELNSSGIFISNLTEVANVQTLGVAMAAQDDGTLHIVAYEGSLSGTVVVYYRATPTG